MQVSSWWPSVGVIHLNMASETDLIRGGDDGI